MTTRCVVSVCSAYGRHVLDCEVEECRGCVPRLALDGLRLCGLHLRRLAEDAVEAARLHSELLQVLTSANGFGEKVRSSRDPNIQLNDAAAEVRTAIQATLVSWCRLISEERGIHLPGRWRIRERPPGFIGPMPREWVHDRDLHALGAYIAKHAEWLAAHPAADDAVSELHDLAHGDARRIAYPGCARRYPLELPDGSYAQCPQQVPQEGSGTLSQCPGTLWTILRRDASLLPSEVVCNHDETHRWPTSRWLKLGAQLLGQGAA